MTRTAIPLSVFADALMCEPCDALTGKDDPTKHYIGDPPTALPKYLVAFDPKHDAVCEVRPPIQDMSIHG
jgi:hypothetical protein